MKFWRAVFFLAADTADGTLFVIPFRTSPSRLCCVLGPQAGTLLTWERLVWRAPPHPLP